MYNDKIKELMSTDPLLHVKAPPISLQEAFKVNNEYMIKEDIVTAILEEQASFNKELFDDMVANNQQFLIRDIQKQLCILSSTGEINLTLGNMQFINPIDDLWPESEGDLPYNIREEIRRGKTTELYATGKVKKPKPKPY